MLPTTPLNTAALNVSRAVLADAEMIIAEANLLAAKLQIKSNAPQAYADERTGLWPFAARPVWASGVRYYRASLYATLRRTHDDDTANDFWRMKNLHDAVAFAKDTAINLLLIHS